MKDKIFNISVTKRIRTEPEINELNQDTFKYAKKQGWRDQNKHSTNKRKASKIPVLNLNQVRMNWFIISN
jgi:hypothetical protein